MLKLIYCFQRQQSSHQILLLLVMLKNVTARKVKIHGGTISSEKRNEGDLMSQACLVR